MIAGQAAANSRQTMSKRGHGRCACLLVVLLGAAGCHSVVLKPVTITPAPTIITPHLAVEVDRVGVNRIECMTGETDGCARARTSPSA